MAKLSWPGWLVIYWDRFSSTESWAPDTVTHPSTNRAWRRLHFADQDEDDSLYCYPEAKASVPGTSNKLDEWVIEWLIEYAVFLQGLSNGGHDRNESWHKGSLQDEDDARTLNTRIAWRKHAISHSIMKNMRSNRQEYDWWHVARSGGFNWRPHVQWPTRPQHNGPLEASRVVAL